MHDARAVEVHEVVKDFGEVRAVAGISFEVNQGEIFSLLGPNGAGKSTTISILSCLLDPTSGRACVMGHDVQQEPMAVKRSIGVVPQDVALYQDLTGRENLDFWGKMYGLRGGMLNSRVEEVLEIVGLTDRQKSRVDTYSGGMKRRLNIAAALMHRPDVIIMDEPTVGIDPQSRRYILDNIKLLNSEGMTVLYTTHYMEEAQEISDRIGIMDRGQLIALGTHAELVQMVGEQDRIDLKLSSGVDRLMQAWPEVEGVRRVTRGERFEEAPLDGHVTLLVEDSNLILPRLFESANGVGARINSVEIQEPNLEAVFLHLTGRTLRD